MQASAETIIASTPRTMAGLKERLDAAIIPALGPPGRRRVAYLDLPLHGNLGDQLIAEGTEAFLAANGVEVVVRMSEADFNPSRLAALPRDVVLLWHGGGNMGDLWPFFERMRQGVVAACRDHRIVLLPQTIHFADPDALAGAAAVYRAHPDLVLFVRDLASLEVARGHLAADARLAPDMAHYLWGMPDSGADDAAPRAGGGTVLELRRRDDERRDGAPDRGVDWSDIVPPTRMACLVAHRTIIRHMARRMPPAALGPLYQTLAVARRRAIAAARSAFRQHRAVATDRLHATILGALLGLDVIPDDNSYGKISRYWGTWTGPGSRA